jgi:hypothetical protein
MPNLLMAAVLVTVFGTGVVGDRGGNGYMGKEGGNGLLNHGSGNG